MQMQVDSTRCDSYGMSNAGSPTRGVAVIFCKPTIAQQVFMAPLAPASPVYDQHSRRMGLARNLARNHNETTNETTRIFTHNQRNRWFL